MKTVTFYLIMICDFKFVLWINCETELIRKEKQKKKRHRTRRLGLFAYFLPDAT
ncbi:JOSD3 protein [Escherichia fergusonii B253]|nr:JOSD3 protein [Escherichia fergusonii B253]